MADLAIRQLATKARRRACFELPLLAFGYNLLCFGSSRGRRKKIIPGDPSVDEPGVEDEITLPSISSARDGDPVGARRSTLSAEISKKLTNNTSVIVRPAFTSLRPGASGFENLETGVKYQFVTNPSRELVLSAGLFIEFGGTGSAAIGAERFSTFTPTLFFGKGAGNLPDSLWWARPIAVTGQIGYGVPSSPSRTVYGAADEGRAMVSVEHHPQFIMWGGTFQYSLPYLKQNVRDVGLPDLFNRLIPLVEVSIRLPSFNNFDHQATTGTVNPGVLWDAGRLQIGAEALLPINKPSGRRVGFKAQVTYNFGLEEGPASD